VSNIDRPFAPPAKDSSLIPNGEADLIPLALADTDDHPIDLTRGSTAFVQTPAGSPLILLVKADGDFYEGQAATDAAKNAVREGNMWHAIAVSGRSAWHFRAVAATVTIKGKLLTGS
jgi:hypothetical protein